MIAYVVAYSVILLLLAISAVVLCGVIMQKRNAERRKQVVSNSNESDIFFRIYGKDEGVAFILVEEENRLPVYVSENVTGFFGVTAEDVYHDTYSILRNLTRPSARALKKKLASWSGVNNFEYEFTLDSEHYSKMEAFRAEYDGKGYIAYTVFDITDEKNAQKEMKLALGTALSQAAAKSSFLSSMSHEIRTPMNGIMGMMSLAKMNIDDKQKVLNYLERAGDLSVFLLGMINDILDISKIESGKMQLFTTDMDVFAFAEKFRNMFTGTITGKGIEFNVETVGFTVRYLVADELRLTQVVTNLISNANKFTPAGGRIDVTFKQLDNIGGSVQLMIRVRDTGKGIAPENIRKILRPFEQEEASTAHNYGGTGLGLAICDNIVRMMGGNIVIDSTVGKGSDFSVFLSLPVSDVAQDLNKPVEHEEKIEAGDFTFEGCRILLAEDNEINAEIAIDILESEGAKVTHAVDGQQALEIYKQSEERAFDLILLDIQMPRLDGRGAAKAMRNSGREDAYSVPIVALSADAFVEDEKLSEAAGMDAHISKPVDFDLLRKRAGEIIAMKKSGKYDKKKKKH